MKNICALILLVSSWPSVHGCQLAGCTSVAFASCPGWVDQSCRALTTLDLSNRNLFGALPSGFYQLYANNINGDAANGIPKVELEKVDLSNNQLSGLIGNILECPTIKEANFEGNSQLGSSQIINKEKLDALEILNLKGTGQTDMKWLSNKAPNLKTLNLANNQLSDISSITTMSKLTSLDLSGNDQIGDLTVLASLTNLQTLTVDPKLQQQSDILTSGGTAETKRSGLLALSIAEIKALAAGNTDSMEQMSSTVNANVQQLTMKNLALEGRVAALEAKINQINTACLVEGTGGFSQPTVGGGNADDSNLDLDGGNDRRRLTGCAVVSSATATGLLSVAVMTAAAMLL